jgi:hypothetical protein
MKYLKLFENFNESELIEKDIINCLLGLDDSPKLLNNELNNNLFVFGVPGDYSKSTDDFISDFNAAKGALEDEGYTLLSVVNDLILSEKALIIKTEYLNRDKTFAEMTIEEKNYSLEEIALQYLEQFKGIKDDKGWPWPVYKDKDGKIILMIQEGKVEKIAIIAKDIWYLLDLIFPTTEVDLVQSLGVNRRVEKILKDWIIENYGFTDITKVKPN